MPQGRVLFPAEGEGRNAVYAARKGFNVHAFDFSREGQKKALALAVGSGVTIDYRVTTYEEADYPAAWFDAVVLVFAHMPPGKRRQWHRKLAGFLAPGGTLVIEGFSKEQLGYPSGGPRDIEMLYSEEELLLDFEELEVVELEKKVIQLEEGLYHKGPASVIRGQFRK